MAIVIIALVALEQDAPRALVRATLAIGAAVLAYAAFGLLNGAILSDAFVNLRGPVRVLAAASAVAYLCSKSIPSTLRTLLRALSFVSVCTAAVVAGIAFFGIGGFDIRSGNAAMYTSSSSIVYDATRVTPDSGLACVTLSGVLIVAWLLWDSRPLGSRTITVIIIVCGLFIGLISYTRGHLLVLGVVLVGATILRIGDLSFIVRALGMLTAIVVGGAAVLMSVKYAFPSIFAPIENAMSAFSGRVLSGLSASTAAADTSTQWRVRESALALQYFRDNWLFGSGLGVRYRSPMRGEIFTGTRGLTYIHSAYLWILVKLGIVGAVALLIGLFVFVKRLFVRRDDFVGALSKMILLVTIGYLVQMITSPTPFESGNSVVVGLIVGLGLACTSTKFPGFSQDVTGGRRPISPVYSSEMGKA
ncbi:O-antigen ligase family protein [Rhodococcus pyridinivorans]|uniref:O-antigen ligase family protein n=1 Tax=Rhodococcus pyridinivorans TaxID=103816 RepID=UPI0037CCC250